MLVPCLSVTIYRPRAQTKSALSKVSLSNILLVQILLAEWIFASDGFRYLSMLLLSCYCILHVILSHLLHSTCQIPPSWPSSSLELLSGDFHFYATKELAYKASSPDTTLLFNFDFFLIYFFDEMNFLLCMTIFHEPPFFNRCFMYVWAMKFLRRRMNY